MRPKNGRRNLQELVNAAPPQYQEENEGGSLEGFLASAALASDADSKDTRGQPGSPLLLDPCHASKRAEFPVVLPRWAGAGSSSPATAPWRSLRPGGGAGRLCYVGITPAPRERCSSPTPAKGGSWAACAKRRLAVACFSAELSGRRLIQGDIPQSGCASIRREQTGPGSPHSGSDPRGQPTGMAAGWAQAPASPGQCGRRRAPGPDLGRIGDQCATPAIGRRPRLTHLFGSCEKNLDSRIKKV